MIATDTAGWITAAGTVFAAIGTVAAVAVALWQSGRRQKVQLDVTFSWVTRADHGKWPRTVELTARNVGVLSIRIDQAVLQLHGQKMSGVLRTASDLLPHTLTSDDTLTAVWDYDQVEQMREEFGAQPFAFGFFIDVLGRSYSAPYPGVSLSRRNWRLAKRYVQPKAGAPLIPLLPQAGNTDVDSQSDRA
jgi:hypothetical protein